MWHLLVAKRMRRLVLSLATATALRQVARRPFIVQGTAAAAAATVGVDAARAGELDPRVLDLAVELGSLEKSRAYTIASGTMTPTAPQSAIKSLCGAGTIWLGESRDVTDDDSMAAGICAALAVAKAAQQGGKTAPVAVGLEAVRADYQTVLDKFVLGEIGADREATAFLAKALDWDAHWPYPIERYAQVFELCRSLSLPIVALGAPAKDLVTAASQGLNGLDANAWARLSLPEGPEPLMKFASTMAYQQYRQKVLEPDFERFARFKRAAPFFEAASTMDGNDDFAKFYTSRLLWDASMAARAANWVDQSPRKDATLIALVGAEHASYGCGAAAHCAARSDRPARTVIVNPPAQRPEAAAAAPAPVRGGAPPTGGALGLELTFASASPRDGATDRMQARDPAASSLPLADLVWFSPYETLARGANFI